MSSLDMGAAAYSDKAVDVICQHNSDGTMIPLKVRLVDEDGLVQTYKIKSFKDLSHKGAFTMPNGIVATSSVLPFECKVQCFGSERSIMMYYLANEHVWKLTAPYGRNNL